MDKERPEYKRVRERIVVFINRRETDMSLEEMGQAESDLQDGYYKRFIDGYYEVADEIISIEGLEIKSDDQTLPLVPAVVTGTGRLRWMQAQESLLSANFVKVI